MTSGYDTRVAPRGVACRNEKGMVLIIALLFTCMLAMLGTTAVMTTTTDIKIGANYRDSEQAFYAAQAGVEEATARLRAGAAGAIDDQQPAEVGWRAYIGDLAKAGDRGYDSNSGMHVRYESLQSNLDYTVVIKHKTDREGNMVYWGDTDGNGSHELNVVSGGNVYVVSGHGFFADSHKAIEVEIARAVPVTAPAALYGEATTTVHGDKTNINGTDACGGTDKPGIVTTEASGSVTTNGDPHITGAGGSEPDIVYDGTDSDIEEIVNSFKESADFSYEVDSATHTVDTTPGPGQGWGDPIPGPSLEDPYSCTSNHVVHYDTGGTYVRLQDGVSGCGVLLIEGDLEVEGSFSWYGLVAVTGSVLFGGPGDRNITGSVMAGGSVVLDVTGGSTNIVYCSSAITAQSQKLPLSLLSWKEDM
ncbi:MAG: pilus assembly PilX N-terminal domain-containing protein [Thermodesulfobacteriota bacterium]|nr:pilus assembly PilX N-terminal domain-containing protein [Thermodesulfobacteriota bacterium]